MAEDGKLHAPWHSFAEKKIDELGKQAGTQVTLPERMDLIREENAEETEKID